MCAHVRACNASLLGWRQDWTAMAAWLSCEAGRRSDGRYGGGMFVEGACLHADTHTHTCSRSDDTQTQTHTGWLAGTILASERRSQSHRRSFQEGRPQSHCTGFPTGEGGPGESGEEGGRRGRRKSVCVCLSVCSCLYGARPECRKVVEEVKVKVSSGTFFFFLTLPPSGATCS